MVKHLRAALRFVLAVGPGLWARFKEWIGIWLFFMAAIWIVSPENLSVVFYKLLLATVAVIVASRIHRALFPKGKPEDLIDDFPDNTPWTVAEAIVFAGATVSRALVIMAVVLAIGLGL